MLDARFAGRRTALGAAAAVLLAAAMAAGDEPARSARLDGTLRLVAAGRLSASALGARGPRVTVSARVHGGAAALRALGFSAREAGPETAYLEVDPAELDRLARAPAVQAVERVRLLRPTLDRSAPLAGATAARAAFGLDGKGVLVGLVDTGIDFRHADFRSADGHTRLHALLDLSLPRGPLHPELPDYGQGALWLAADVDAQLEAEARGEEPAAAVTESDVSGHGTHVAGIAAANGRASGRGLPAERYVGMAPMASLLVVKATRHGATFDEEDLVTSVRFVLERAAAEQRPVVVNLSVGGEGGPHDGTLNVERALSDLVPSDAPGRALVVSAGNAGSRDHHAGGLVLPDGAIELRLDVPKDAPRSEPLAADLWFDGPPPPITLVDPAGHAHGPVPSGGSLDEDAGDSIGRLAIDAASRGVDPVNHRWEAAFYVEGAGGQPVGAGAWKLVLDGSGGAGARAGRWDAWLVDVDPGQNEPRFLDHLDEDSRADFPAFARSAIAVGSFVSRNGWPTVDGRQIARGTVVGRASSFTGSGPSLDGRFLPDLAAPGDFVLSSMSVDAPGTSGDSIFHLAGDPTFLVGDDGVHGAARGTSQAAPHVAGAVALLFQLDPTLTPARLRELLRTSASVDRGAPGYSTRLGFGRLDVARAAALLERAPHGAVDPGVSSVGVSRDAVLPPDSRVLVSVVPRDEKAMPLGAGRLVTIDADAGRFDGPTRDAGEGRYERTLIAAGVLGTACTITATVDGVPLSQHPLVWFVRDRSEVGRPFAARGGCRAAATTPAAAGPLALALLAWLGCRRARRARARRT